MGGKEQKLSGLSRRPLGMRCQSRLTVIGLLIADILVGRYWKREPTGNEFVVQSVLGINHGGIGLSYLFPSTVPFFCPKL
jgi:hypothetical protein